MAWLGRDLLAKLKGKKQMHRVRRDRYPGKGTGMMFSCAGMGRGRLRRSWNWTGQGTQRVIRKASTGMLTRKGRSKKINSVGKLVTMDKEKAELLNNRMKVALPRRVLEG